jgi:TolB-like protein/class 3 adenylate cyclase
MEQDRPARIERKLSAILAADVADYCRLMHHAEEATHAKLSVLLTDGVVPAIAAHGGRIFKNMGDGFLAEFPSAVQAVRAAVQFQARTRELVVADAEDRRITFRVGINVGDVIVEPHDVFGDAVNVASRLESIADPGGICISSSAYDHIQGKVDTEFVDLGEQILKNIARPVRAFAAINNRCGPTTRAATPAPITHSAPRISIVVLPFTNLSGDPEQDYFVDGVTGSLTADLSRISGSFVIGRHTAFTYKDKAIDPKQIGRELNVRYVLEGSLQRSGDRVRINVELVDAETCAHLWADRFDKPVADLFDMQDEIVSRLANALEAQLTEQEARRSARSPSPNSMDLYFQASASLHKGRTPEHLAQARDFLQRALALDPENTAAIVGMAMVDLSIGSGLYSADRTARLAMAEDAVMKALCQAPNYALAHLVLGDLLILSNRAAQGIAECERALALDHNLAGAYAQIGAAKFLTGRATETEAHMNEAFRLSPRDINASRWLLFAGAAKFQLVADDEAVDLWRRSLEVNRNFPITHFLLAGSLALLGLTDQAKAAAKAGFAFDPGFTVRRFRNGALSDHPTYLAMRERLYQGMRLAGVPEG